MEQLLEDIKEAGLYKMTDEAMVKFYQQQSLQADPVTYREYDVDSYQQGVNRGAEIKDTALLAN